MAEKLGVIVPYRDREEQLKVFVPHIHEVLHKEGICHEIIVVEQTDKELFTRGSLLNIGFLEAKRLGCTYVAFHDVDMLPVSVSYAYPELEGPVQLASSFVDEEGTKLYVATPYNYFGGVTLFRLEDFEKCNGYDNNYKGWGFEDDDLLLRCNEVGVSLSRKVFSQESYSGSAINFDGKSCLEFHNPFNFRKSCIIYADFVSEALPVNPRLAHDEGAIFAIPGLDIALSRESFNTYKFEFFDNYEDCYSIHTKSMPHMHCQAVIYFDSVEKSIVFGMNHKVVGGKTLLSDRFIKVGSNKLRLGAADIDRKAENYKKLFTGKIIRVAGICRTASEELFHQILQEGIDSVEDQDIINFNVDASDVDSSRVVDIDVEPRKIVQVGKSRAGKFMLQKHKGNGAIEGYWQNWHTRLNQIKYNEHLRVGTDRQIDGLSNVASYLNWKVEKEDMYYRIKASRI